MAVCLQPSVDVPFHAIACRVWRVGLVSRESGVEGFGRSGGLCKAVCACTVPDLAQQAACSVYSLYQYLL